MVGLYIPILSCTLRQNIIKIHVRIANTLNYPIVSDFILFNSIFRQKSERKLTSFVTLPQGVALCVLLCIKFVTKCIMFY